MMDKIILTISVLTSRKEDQVRRCLESLAPLRREVPSELIVIDTSEEEHMHKVVSEYADLIVPFHWIQDFSAARNAGLEKAKGEWFLYLDDDEWFVELQEIIDFFKSGEYKDYNGATYIQRNFSNMSGTMWDDDWVSRMAKIQPGTHFQSPIHEYFEPAPDASKGLRAIVNHFGYVFVSEEQKMAHYERNQVLIQQMIDREPDKIRWRMQMMLEYASVDKYKELLQLAEECFRDFGESRDPEVHNAISSFYASKMVAYENQKDYDSAYQTCIAALDDSRTSRLGRAYFYTYMGEYAMQKGMYAEAEKAELEYLKLYEYFQDNEAEQIMMGAVPFIMQTCSAMYYKRACSLLICAGLKQKNPAYLKRYYSKLRFQDRPAYLLPALPETMVEAMAAMDAEKLFVKTLRDLSQYEDVWQKFEIALLGYVMDDGEGADQLIHLLEKAGIQATFMKLYPLRKTLSDSVDELADDELISMLKDFAKLDSEYYQDIYGDGEKQKDTPDFPSDYRASLVLNRIFAEEDIRKRIPMLKEVVKEYPPFSQAMKRYAEYLGARLTEREEKADNPQLDQMARQILGNVQMMLDSGLTDEAYNVIRQLREMLPDDPEIMEMEHQISLQLR